MFRRKSKLVTYCIIFALGALCASCLPLWLVILGVAILLLTL